MKYKNPPGSFIYTGNNPQDTVITHVQYTNGTVKLNNEIMSLSEEYVDWISIEGLSDVDKITSLCKSFDVDELTIEDILNLNQRNKFEVHDNYLFSVYKYFYVLNGKVKSDYISTLLFPEVIITFTEVENQFKQDILKRLENSNALLHILEEDYLYYVFYDIIVDEGMNAISHIKEKLEILEQDIMDFDTKNNMSYILYINN